MEHTHIQNCYHTKPYSKWVEPCNNKDHPHQRSSFQLYLFISSLLHKYCKQCINKIIWWLSLMSLTNVNFLGTIEVWILKLYHENLIFSTINIFLRTGQKLYDLTMYNHSFVMYQLQYTTIHLIFPFLVDKFPLWGRCTNYQHPTPIHLKILVQTLCYWVKNASSLHLLWFFLHEYSNWNILLITNKSISNFFSQKSNPRLLTNQSY